MRYIEGRDRNQIVLFPECLDDYISEENSVRVIDSFVDTLNLKKLGFVYSDGSGLGRPPYDPRVHLKLYIYGYLNRIRSSRRLEHEAIRNIEVIWLLRELRPDFKTIADFRKDNKKPLKKVFREFNALCDEWGLFGKEIVAIDGTKFKASNSKRNNFSKKKLDRHVNYIDKKIDKYLDDLDEADALEECDRKPDAKEIKKRINQLKERKQKYEKQKKELEETGKAEISLTDPDARLMANNNNNVDVSYNVQTTTDAQYKLLADYKVIQNPCDQGELSSMGLRATVLMQKKI